MSSTRQLSQDPKICKRKRLAKGWTQQELATEAGLSNAAVHQIESGQVDASVASLKKLAAAFGCEIEDLLSGAAG